jgi:hypothetical protein
MTETDIDINDLGLIDDGDVPVDLDNLPKDRSSIARELPIPGATLAFTLPLITKENIGNILKPLPTPEGQRLQLQFRDEYALTLSNGQPFENTFFGKDQAIRKEGAVVGFTNDIAKLLKATGYTGILNSKSDYVKAVLAVSGASFKADNAPKPFCNPNKGVFKNGKKDEATLGCGRGYGLKADSYEWKGKKYETFGIPRDASGAYKTKFECACGALLSAWPRLENYRAGSK